MKIWDPYYIDLSKDIASAFIHSALFEHSFVYSRSTYMVNLGNNRIINLIIADYTVYSMILAKPKTINTNNRLLMQFYDFKANFISTFFSK